MKKYDPKQRKQDAEDLVAITLPLIRRILLKQMEAVLQEFHDEVKSLKEQKDASS